MAQAEAVIIDLAEFRRQRDESRRAGAAPLPSSPRPMAMWWVQPMWLIVPCWHFL
jgi:hypothetical protein